MSAEAHMAMVAGAFDGRRYRQFPGGRRLPLTDPSSCPLRPEESRSLVAFLPSNEKPGGAGLSQ